MKDGNSAHSSGSVSRGVQLVGPGSDPTRQIVLPDESSWIETAAATEIALQLFKATGANLTIAPTKSCMRKSPRDISMGHQESQSVRMMVTKAFALAQNVALGMHLGIQVPGGSTARGCKRYNSQRWSGLICVCFARTLMIVASASSE